MTKKAPDAKIESLLVSTNQRALKLAAQKRLVDSWLGDAPQEERNEQSPENDNTKGSKVEDDDAAHVFRAQRAGLGSLADSAVEQSGREAPTAQEKASADNLLALRRKLKIKDPKRSFQRKEAPKGRNERRQEHSGSESEGKAAVVASRKGRVRRSLEAPQPESVDEAERSNASLTLDDMSSAVSAQRFPAKRKPLSYLDELIEERQRKLQKKQNKRLKSTPESKDSDAAYDQTNGANENVIAQETAERATAEDPELQADIVPQDESEAQHKGQVNEDPPASAETEEERRRRKNREKKAKFKQKKKAKAAT